jgi:DNA-binding GntR family transcriptional regulator
MNKLVRTPNLTELTYRSIKQTLLQGDLDRSFRITEEYLANRLGISKSPVREALNRLEAEGLIRIEARRGAYVRQFGAKEVRDLFDLRVMLELHSIANAQITPSLLAEMAASIARTEKNLALGDRFKHIEEDMRFHALIAEATGNQELASLFDNVQQKSVLCRMESYDLSASRSPSAHKRVYLAMLHEDRTEARKAMEEHIVYVRDRLLVEAEARAESILPLQPELSAASSPKLRIKSNGRVSRTSTPTSARVLKPRAHEPVSLSAD